MDILFSKKLKVKQGLIILAIRYVSQTGSVTWKKLANALEMSPVTVKTNIEPLIQMGLVTVEVKKDELGGYIPTEIYLHEDKLKEFLEK